VSVSDDEPTLPGPENEQVDEGKLCEKLYENQLAPSCSQASFYSNSNGLARHLQNLSTCTRLFYSGEPNVKRSLARVSRPVAIVQFVGISIVPDRVRE